MNKVATPTKTVQTTENAALGDLSLLSEEALEALPIKPFPLWPSLFNVSGLYEWKQTLLKVPVPRPLPISPHDFPSTDSFSLNAEAGPEALEYNLDLEPRALPFFPFRREELRLDVDSRYPQQTASGTLFSFNRNRAHWIASLTKLGANLWRGNIWFKDGQASMLPYTNVEIKTTNILFGEKKASVKFYGGGAPSLVRTFKFASSYHHTVEFEYDVVDGTTAVTQINTHAHPNRPASLPNETLTIEKVFQRSGFNVSISAGSGGLPITGAGADHRWTDMEMHDAMQIYWSRFANKPQWAMWVLFAAQHVQGSSLGGIMFDSIGANHRQGTAIFNNSFIADAPAGDPAPAAWVARMKFWTAVHEMGHAFNLAHSWQKHIEAPWGTTWIPLTSDTEARSFMNYPYNVAGGQSAFFSDFDYRFVDEELLYMRHAPARFVQMGNEDWFTNHGYEQPMDQFNANLSLEVRANRPQPRFEFLEPVTLELKLKNVSLENQILDIHAIEEADHLMVLVKRPNGEVRRWQPFAHKCHKPGVGLLAGGDSLYASLPLFAGTSGWLFDEPGKYEVKVMMEHENLMVTSQDLAVFVMPPRSYEEQVLAQDFFSDEVARTLAFGGSHVLVGANDVLHTLQAKHAECKASIYAAAALAQPQLITSQLLDLDKNERLVFRKQKADVKSGLQLTKKRLLTHSADVAETLGHIPFHRTLAQMARNLKEEGDIAAAEEVRKTLESTLSKRKVADKVLQQIKADTASLLAKK